MCVSVSVCVYTFIYERVCCFLACHSPPHFFPVSLIPFISPLSPHICLIHTLVLFTSPLCPLTTPCCCVFFPPHGTTRLDNEIQPPQFHICIFLTAAHIGVEAVHLEETRPTGERRRRWETDKRRTKDGDGDFVPRP